MHTVELLEAALAVAARLGYRIRQDWLGGARGGACELKGQKWLLLDPDSDPAEQLELVLEALAQEPRLAEVELSSGLARLMAGRRAA